MKEGEVESGYPFVQFLGWGVAGAGTPRGEWESVLEVGHARLGEDCGSFSVKVLFRVEASQREGDETAWEVEG